MNDNFRKRYPKPTLLISNNLYRAFESYNLDSNWRKIAGKKPEIYKAERSNAKVFLQNPNSRPESLTFKKDAVISLLDKILKFRDKDAK